MKALKNGVPERIRTSGPQIHTSYGFCRHRVLCGFVVWTFSLPYPEGLRHRPSSLCTFPIASGLAQDYQFKGFPEFERIH